WWRDVADAAVHDQPALDHPVARAFLGLMRRRSLYRPWLDELFAARERELETDGFATLSAMEQHAEMTAVRLAWLSLEMIDVRSEQAQNAARDAAMAYALLGLARATPYFLSRGRLLLAADLVGAAGLARDHLQAGQGRDTL